MAPSKLRAFAIAGAVIVSASTLSLAAPKGDAEGVAKRIAPVARVELAPASAATAAGNRGGEEIYKSICGACHDSTDAQAHIQVQTTGAGAESCGVCHDADAEWSVERVHRAY